ncbi:hypothetical protein GMORB2_0728 [Geosmithia morbida]|uniref:Uncharacterized protein n=1 Tax=Geosmithia morbida TaxID=1094350 RepID=A0A9P4Z1Q7_9HYPO|nr:uncharacterized protein GMORB2_0728 [Geosmithia morbida]KAF4126990.1 hypothetical protein GMORB2_0728 [Geosmithia morbida]
MAFAFMQRRVAIVWVLSLLTILLFFVFLHRDAAISKAASWGFPGMADTDESLASTSDPSPASTSDPSPLPPLFSTWTDDVRRVAILETGGTHDEVTAALVHAFGGVDKVELTMMLKRQRYKMEDIMAAFDLVSPVSKVASSDDFPGLVGHTDRPQAHVLVSTTCLLDTSVHPAAFRRILDRTDTHLICLVHHADRWEEGESIDLIRDFAAQGRADFLGLSPHTVQYLRDVTLKKWGTQADAVTTRVLPPVFPVASLPEPHGSALGAGGINLALQGDYSSGRRDYVHTFEQLAGLMDELAGKKSDGVDQTETDEKGQERGDTVTLHLIGHGNKPDVPDNLTGNVVFDEDLSYPDFYRVLSEAFAVLPAFASDEYLDRKASSTVPAALIAGAPMVATQAILDAYSYLPRDAVWLSEPDEDEMDTIRRFIGDEAAYLERATKMREGRARILEENRVHVGEWIDEILAKKP